MHAYRRHIRPCIHRRHGQAVTEIQMCSVCLVYENLHTVFMRQLCNCTKIGANSIIGRIIDKYRLGIRMAVNRCGNILRPHTKCNAKQIIDAGIYIDRNCTAENQGIDGASMHITRHDDLIAASYCREYHRLHRAGRAAHHEKSMCSPKCLSCKMFRIANHGDRMAEIIEHLHGVYVNIKAGISKKCCKLRISTTTLMPRDIKGNKAGTLHPLKRLLNRSTRLREVRHYFPSVRSLETSSS